MADSLGTLYLIPNTLEEKTDFFVNIPSGIKKIMMILDGVFAENPKRARSFLQKFILHCPIQEFPIKVLHKRTSIEAQKEYLTNLSKGQNWGVISDAGCPAIADPGTYLVSEAHKLGIKIKPLVGPSSILLALMASGLPGQRFAFHGYLSKVPKERIRFFKKLEKESIERDMSQIFMETPFRNDYLMADLLRNLKKDTFLTVATDLTLKTEEIHTFTTSEWQVREFPKLHKRPTIFIIYATEE